MKKLKVAADMGCIRIFSGDFSCFFSNGFGDGIHEVRLNLNGKKFVKPAGNWFFEGHFEVHKEAYLSGYDCEETSIFEFPIGRYGVYSDTGTILIERWD